MSNCQIFIKILELNHSGFMKTNQEHGIMYAKAMRKTKVFRMGSAENKRIQREAIKIENQRLFMKLRTRLFITFATMVILPLVLTGIAYLSIWI